MIVYQSCGDTYARLTKRERATLRAAQGILERVSELQGKHIDSDLIRAETGLCQVNQVLYEHDGSTEKL